MKNFARELVEDYKKQIAEAVQAGTIEKDSYTWQDMLADYTGVKVESLEDLSADELKQIYEAYREV